jgi:hypothetical protein
MMSGGSGGEGASAFGGKAPSLESTARSQSGSIRTGSQNFGGINVPPKSFEFNTQTLLILGGVVVGFFVLKRFL